MSTLFSLKKGFGYTEREKSAFILSKKGREGEGCERFGEEV